MEEMNILEMNDVMEVTEEVVKGGFSAGKCALIGLGVAAGSYVVYRGVKYIKAKKAKKNEETEVAYDVVKEDIIEE